MSDDYIRGEACPAAVKEALKKAGKAALFIFRDDDDRNYAMKVAEKAQIPLQIFELKQEPNDGCDSIIREAEADPPSLVLYDGVKPKSTILLTGDLERDKKTAEAAVLGLIEDSPE